MTTRTNSYHSRWGYHPSTYGLYLKLKFLHAQYWQTVYDFHLWHRWVRKEPQNRVGDEPGFCKAFVTDTVWLKQTNKHGQEGYKIYPKTVTDHGMIELFQTARMPQPEPVQPLEASVVDMIETLYEKVMETTTQVSGWPPSHGGGQTRA